jgi:hypothetical protein
MIKNLSFRSCIVWGSDVEEQRHEEISGEEEVFVPVCCGMLGVINKGRS